MPSRNTAPDAHTQNYSFKDERLPLFLHEWHSALWPIGTVGELL